MDREHGLVHAVEGIPADEAFEGLDAERALTEGEAALATHTALTQAFQLIRTGVVGTGDDAQCSRPRTFTAGCITPLRPRATNAVGLTTTTPHRDGR